MPDHKVWMKAADAAPGIDARLGVDPSGSEWAVEINAPPQPGDHNRLSGIAEDSSGGLHLLRQGWLRGRRPAPDIREEEFARLTGLTPVPVPVPVPVAVAATGRAAARRWFLVASLDDPPERIRRTTARFVQRCEAARNGGDAARDAGVAFVTDLDQLFANVATLDNVRTAGSDDELAAYLGLIRRGTCFLPYATRDGIAFAPSRFIGYVSRETRRVRIELEIPDEDGKFPTGIDNLIEALPRPQLSDAAKMEAHFDAKDTPIEREETASSIAELSAKLAALPRLTREVFKFLIERRDERSAGFHDEFRISDPKLRRIYHGDDLDGDLALLQEAHLLSANEPDNHGESGYWRIHFPGSGYNFHLIFIEYVTDLGLDLRKPLVTLDFSDF